MTTRKCDRGGCTNTGDEATFAYIEAPGIFDRPRWYCPDCGAAFRKLLAAGGGKLAGIDKLDDEGNATGREPPLSVFLSSYEPKKTDRAS